jgi:hypothetical protein
MTQGDNLSVKLFSINVKSGELFILWSITPTIERHVLLTKNLCRVVEIYTNSFNYFPSDLTIYCIWSLECRMFFKDDLWIICLNWSLNRTFSWIGLILWFASYWILIRKMRRRLNLCTDYRMDKQFSHKLVVFLKNDLVSQQNSLNFFSGYYLSCYSASESKEFTIK